VTRQNDTHRAARKCWGPRTDSAGATPGEGGLGDKHGESSARFGLPDVDTKTGGKGAAPSISVRGCRSERLSTLGSRAGLRRSLDLRARAPPPGWCTTPTASPPVLVPRGRLRPHAGELERRRYPLPHWAPQREPQTAPPGTLARPRYLAPLCPQWHLVGAVLPLPGCWVVPNPHRLARRRVGEDFARRLRRLAGNLAASSVTVPAEERKHDPDDHDRYDHPFPDAQWGPLTSARRLGQGARAATRRPGRYRRRRSRSCSSTSRWNRSASWSLHWPPWRRRFAPCGRAPGAARPR